MSDLDTVNKCVDAFYRLVGTVGTDPALTELGESTDEVAYTYLTRGTRVAQRWLLKMSYHGWRKRSAAITWSGTDAADGGRYLTLPSDFLRAAGTQQYSCLVEADGDRWGTMIEPEDAHLKGDYFYFRGSTSGDQIWLARNASPPTTVYLEYHYIHPLWTASVTIDFPLEIRALFVAEAANEAKEENWLPGGREMETKIERALIRAKEEARDFARRSKQTRTIRKPPRYGNRW